MAELRSNILFNGRHFVRHLGIYNPICVKLLQVMSGVIPSNLKEKRRLSQDVFLRSTNAAYTHTHTHDDGIISEMQCVAFRLKILRELT